MEPEELVRRLRSGNVPPILDVRSRREFEAGHVPGARHVPFWAVWWRARAILPERDSPVLLYCGEGPRARIASALLRLQGYRRLVCLTGHMSGWQRGGHPIERGPTQERR